ncbi:HAMP domain-containing sensor histidine kinase [Luteibacter sp. 9133]|uniref:ATP-binding protein n=1 Tax=Luteibacter sp. 9133 TaxID=1500891 RepID=UPI0005BBCABE|nr:HAMP domain-containing sensor histidine kinase [Luteibacter sp. 9133]
MPVFNALSRQLFVIWALVALACVGMGVLLLVAWRQTGSVQVAHARQTLSADCAAVVSRYRGASPAARASSPSNGLLDVVLQLVLQDASGVEGGAWQSDRGFTAYAYPTYEGSGDKTDVPEAESGNIVTTASAAVSSRREQSYVRQGERETVLITACPLDTTRAVWTMTRLARAPGRSSSLLAAGIGLPFALALASAIGLVAIMRRWRRKLDAVEDALTRSSGVPALPRTGSPEVDRLADAVVAYASRLDASHREAEALSTELRRHERLVGLGRMTATVAHEIRNPIATMRLAAENALAAPSVSDEQRAPLTMVLAQVRKLDDLVESLLGMVQPIRLRLEDTAIEAWVASIERATWKDVGPVTVERRYAPDLHWAIDREQLSRAVENLLRNAFQHAADVGMAVVHDGHTLRITVTNAGPSLDPEIEERLFEPFASGRVDGNGLGLALVREIAEGHGGHALYERDDGVHAFSLEIPWRRS